MSEEVRPRAWRAHEQGLDGSWVDRRKYRSTLWKPGPFGKWKKTTDETFAALAHRFFEWMGPATVKEFQGFGELTEDRMLVLADNPRMPAGSHRIHASGRLAGR